MVVSERLSTLHPDITFESVSIFGLHAELVVHDTLGDLDELYCLRVGLVDEVVTLEERDRGLHVDLARVALSTQVELDHRDGKELSVTASVDWHGHFRLLLIGSCEVLETLRGLPDGVDGNVFHDKVGELKVRLSVLRAEKDFELYGLPSCDSALVRLDAVVSLLISQRDRLCILLLVD